METRRLSFSYLLPTVLLLVPTALPGGWVFADDDRFLISVGTSLSVGIQPDENRNNRRTDEGYADQLFEIFEDEIDDLELVKLGCPGETSTAMIVGGELSRCSYPAGSQLNEAVSFLRAHRSSVELVTIDMGANDSLGCDITDVGCLFRAFATVQFNLSTTILPALREAVGPGVPIVGMNYYNPNLAFWVLLPGPQGQALAIGSNQLAEIFNTTFLGTAYASFDVPVADVFGAFQCGDFSIGPDLLPVNVSVICDLTWMCDAERGPNIHATRDGYRLIAETFAALVDLGGDDDDDDGGGDDDDDD